MAAPTTPLIVGASAGLLTDPVGIGAAAVTPDDDTDLSHTTRALYIGTGGTVALYLMGMTTAAVSFVNVPDGTLLPFQVRRVNSTGTTATNIVAVW